MNQIRQSLLPIAPATPEPGTRNACSDEGSSRGKSFDSMLQQSRGGAPDGKNPPANQPAKPAAEQGATDAKGAPEPTDAPNTPEVTDAANTTAKTVATDATEVKSATDATDTALAVAEAGLVPILQPTPPVPLPPPISAVDPTEGTPISNATSGEVTAEAPARLMRAETPSPNCGENRRGAVSTAEAAPSKPQLPVPSQAASPVPLDAPARDSSASDVSSPEVSAPEVSAPVTPDSLPPPRQTFPSITVAPEPVTSAAIAVPVQDALVTDVRAAMSIVLRVSVPIPVVDVNVPDAGTKAAESTPLSIASPRAENVPAPLVADAAAPDAVAPPDSAPGLDVPAAAAAATPAIPAPASEPENLPSQPPPPVAPAPAAQRPAAENITGTTAAKPGDAMPAPTIQRSARSARATSAEPVVTAATQPVTTIDRTPAFRGAPVAAAKNGREHSQSDHPQNADRPAIAEFTPTGIPQPPAAPSRGADPIAPIRPADVAQVVERTAIATAQLRATGQERLEVAVRLDSGHELTIELHMANGEVMPVIRTESEPLRLALERNWSLFSQRGGDREVRVSTPVFESPQTSSNMSDLNYQRDGRQRAFQEAATEFANPQTLRRGTAPTPPRPAPHTPAPASGVRLYA